MLLNGVLLEHIYGSINGIAQLLSAIQRTSGKGWAAEIKDADGAPLSREEQQQFTEAFQPYVSGILSFLGDRTKGGAVAYDVPDVEELTGLESEPQETSDSTPSDPEKMTGIDNLYAKVIHRIGSINSVVNDYASKYGVLHMEKKSDVEPDVRLIPEPLAQLISKGLMLLEVPPQASMDVMNKFKVPFRLIVFAIYLFLDVARMTASATGSDNNRKILSVVVSVMDLLKGDWKKAVLSFMGYYGTTPLLMGQMAKIFLALFQTLSPTIQDSMIYGALDTTKSFIIGILLAIFKVTAPEGIRLPLIGMLEKIAKKKAEIDGTLTDAGLSARSDSYSPTFDDFNNIQALMDDPEFICSTEFETLIEQVNTTSIINIILQILRIPVTKEFRAYRCGTKPSKPFLTLIVQKGKEDKETQESFDQPFSSKNLQMPVAVGKTGEPKAEEAKQEEPKVEVSEEAKVEEPEEPKVEEPKVEEPKVEEPKAEVAEEPKAEVSEEPKAAPLPPTIESKAEEPKAEPVPFHAPGPKQGGRRRPRRTIRR